MELLKLEEEQQRLKKEEAGDTEDGTAKIRRRTTKT